MSNILPTYQAFAYHHAADVPMEVVRALYQHEAEANVILPFLLKAGHFPRTGTAAGSQLWVAVLDNAKNVEFVLSCTEGPLGNYPVFIVACKPTVQLAEEESHGRDVRDALSPLVRRLLEHVLPQRVFSVFAVASVAKRFAYTFEAETRAQGLLGIRAVLDAPLYDAAFTFCTRETFAEGLSLALPRRGTEDIVINICQADPKIHLRGLAAMCKAFSETSPPYVLDDKRAEKEAMTMIDNQQVWVHTIQKDGAPPEIACLVATTRESDHVTAITKVFSSEKWRGRGCAQRLMHRVCQEILSKDEKKRLVLYVGNSDELAPAREVYHKLGFQGLNVRARCGAAPVPGVEGWLEIGFKGTTLGYW